MISYFRKVIGLVCHGSSWWQVKESAWTKKGEHWTNWIYGNLEFVFVFSGGWEEIQQTWCEKGRTWEGKTQHVLWNPSLVNCKLQVPKRVVVPSGRPRGRPKARTTEGLGRFCPHYYVIQGKDKGDVNRGSSAIAGKSEGLIRWKRHKKVDFFFK